MKWLGKHPVYSDLLIDNVFIQTDPAGSAYDLTLPPNDGSAGQVLTTDGNGVLTWTTVSSGSGTVTSITPGADSGSGTAITTSGTITVAGGTNATTSVSGTTITVNATDTDTTYTAGDGLDLSGTTFSTDLKSNSGLVIDSTELSMDLGASNITGTLAVGDGGTGLTTVGADQILTGNGASALSSESTLKYTPYNLVIGDNGSSNNLISSPAKTSGQVGTEFNIFNGDTSGTDMRPGVMSFSSGMGTGDKPSGAYVFKGGPMGDPLGGTTPSPSRELFSLYTKGGVANASVIVLHDVQSSRDYFTAVLDVNSNMIMQNIHGGGIGTPSFTIDADGDLNLLSSTNIQLNADGGDIDFKDNTAQLAKISTEGISFQDNTGAGVIFEGATDNAYQTTLRATDPTGTRAINLPDDSGTVALQEKSIIVKNMGFYNTSTSAFYLPMLEYIAESTYVTSYVSSFVAPYDGKVIKVGPGWSNNGSSKTSTYKFFKNKQSSTQTGTTATTASFTTTIPEVTPTDWTFSKGEPIHIQVTNSVTIQSVSMTVTIELDLTT